MIHLNHATHAFSTAIYEQRVSQAAGIATLVSPSRHVLIANQGRYLKQLQDSKQMHVCFSPELASELTPFYEL